MTTNSGKEKRTHREDCPALSAWDIPDACRCDRPTLRELTASPPSDLREETEQRIADIEADIAFAKERGTWSDWRIGQVVTIAAPWLIASLRASRSREAEAVKALEPFAAFASRWNRNPLGGYGDTLYAIHAGEDGAELRLSDCRRALAIVSAPSVREPGVSNG